MFCFLPETERVAIEPRFHALLPEKCGIGDPAFAPGWDASTWPQVFIGGKLIGNADDLEAYFGARKAV